MQARLAELGLHLAPGWVAGCVQHLSRVPSLRWAELPLDKQVEHVYKEFLQCDLNHVGSGSLPDSVQTLHKEVLQGRFVLQLDEVVDIGSGFKERYTESNPAGRCLKLHLTDGKRRVVGLEYRRLPSLSVLGAAGLKVAITDVQVRRGLLFLRPDNIQILGGFAPELNTARKRMVERWLQPAGPIREREEGPAKLPQLAAEAAWPDPHDTLVEIDDIAGAEGGGGSRGPRGPETGPGVGGEGGDGRDRVSGGTPSNGTERWTPDRGSMPPSAAPLHSGAHPAGPEGAGSQPSQPWPPGRGGGEAVGGKRQRASAAGTSGQFSGGGGGGGGRGGGGDVAVIIGSSSSSDSEGEFEDRGGVAKAPKQPSGRGSTAAAARGGPAGPPFVYLADVCRKGSRAAAGGRTWVKCSLTSLKGLDFKDARGRPLPEYRAHVTIEDGSCPPQEAAIAHGPMLRMVGRTPADLVSALGGSAQEKTAVRRRLSDATRELMVFEGLMAVEGGGPGEGGLVVTELRPVTVEHARGLLRRAMGPARP